ncbi:hypothetical protein [Eubacterium maltosivorans]|uniref:Uncharacterized protein n=1 Tax=Eubacterium maltosivorans TaxID=2041044 RepID=A0A4P9C6S8_EUBML|nr:hypothetical protein [Eubacterium maltosivorans]QCT71120.1 hypothetical protein CPZ25_007200 [Eubacterium maltosivorans]
MDYTINRGVIRKQVSQIYTDIESIKTLGNGTIEHAMEVGNIQGRINNLTILGLISDEEHNALFQRLMKAQKGGKHNVRYTAERTDTVPCSF